MAATRRFSPIAPNPGEVLLTEPTPAVRPRSRERVFMPQTGRSLGAARPAADVPTLPSQECARTSHPGLMFATAPSCGPTVTLFRDPERPRLIRHETRERTMSLKGKTIVVTGGSRGLGLGLVEALVDQSAKVTVVERDPAALAAVKQKLSVAVISADVTDEAAAKRILADVRPEVLVLNAGATPRMGRLDQLRSEEHTSE